MWEDVTEKLRFPRAHGLESEDARPRREVGRLPCRLSVRLPENGAELYTLKWFNYVCELHLRNKALSIRCSCLWRAGVST